MFVYRILQKVKRHIDYMRLHSRAKLINLSVSIRGKPYIFTDGLGYKYWIYHGEPIEDYLKLGFTTDSSKVMRYIKRFAKPGGVCIDIGARIGAISLALWDAVGQSGTVISVEADPQNILALKSNLKLNDFPCNAVENVAVVDYDGVATLRRFEGCNGWQTIGDPKFARDVPSELFDVPAINFSTLLSRFHLKYINLVKIDVEGAEPIVLKGMSEALSEQRVEQVVFEVNHLMLEGTGNTVDDLMKFWSDFNYRLYLIGPNGDREHLAEGKWPSGHIGDCVAVVEP